MVVTFSLEYVTDWGQELYIVVGSDYDNAQLMAYQPGFRWSITLDVEPRHDGDLHYRYLVRTNGQLSREEACPHVLRVPEGAQRLNVLDAWHDQQPSFPAAGQVITTGYFERRRELLQPVEPGSVTLVLTALDMLSHNHALAVVGATPSMGVWNPANARMLTHTERHTWEITLQIPAHETQVEYKFLVVDTETGEVVEWENGVNRWLPSNLVADAVNVVTSLHYRTRLRPITGVGTRVAVMQLRSDHSAGCGSFTDLVRLVNWAHATEQQAIVLTHTFVSTINALRWGLSPATRRAIADYALDVIFLDVSAVGNLVDKKRLAEHQRASMALNNECVVNPRRVAEVKLAHLYDLYQEQAANLSRQRGFRTFVRDNEFWLKPYAAFVILGELKKGADCSNWGQYATYDAQAIERFLKNRAADCEFVYYVQYHLYRQFHAVCAHAAKCGLRLAYEVNENHPVSSAEDIEHLLTQRHASLVTVPLASWPLLVGMVPPSKDAKNPYRRLWMSVEAFTANTALKRRILALLNDED